MISFLEFVCERLMGPPKYSRSWCCPFHDDHTPSFTVRPPKQRPDGSWEKIRFRCHAGSCGMWGDETDLLRHFHPNETYAQTTQRRKALEEEYKAVFRRDPYDFSQPHSLPGNRGPDPEVLDFCMSELRSVIRDEGKRWRRAEVGLWVLVRASDIAEENGVPLETIARLCASELIRIREARAEQEKTNALDG